MRINDYTWENIIERDGVRLVDSQRVGEYQGDLYMVVRRGDSFGWIDLSYGSCSGCDELEDVRHIKAKRDALAKRVIDSVDFKSKTDLLYWIDNRDWKAQPAWIYSEHKERKAAVAKLRASLVEAIP